MKQSTANVVPRGVIAAIPTPFSDDGTALHEERLRHLVRHVVRGGVSGIMTTGGTGEFPHLTRAERRRVQEIVVSEVHECNSDVSVFAGTAACSTMEAINLGEDAATAGAHALIMTPPYYFPVPTEAVIRHYSEVASCSSLPVVVYNNPLYTGVTLTPRSISELLEMPQIVGLKQSNTNISDLAEVIRIRAPETEGICTGIDSQLLPALCLGASGIFSSAAAIIPRQIVELYELVTAAIRKDVQDEARRLQTLARFLEYDAGYVAPTKDALRLLGVPCGPVRQPLLEMSTEELSELERALADVRESRSQVPV